MTFGVVVLLLEFWGLSWEQRIGGGGLYCHHHPDFASHHEAPNIEKLSVKKDLASCPRERWKMFISILLRGFPLQTVIMSASTQAHKVGHL